MVNTILKKYGLIQTPMRTKVNKKCFTHAGYPPFIFDNLKIKTLIIKTGSRSKLYSNSVSGNDQCNRNRSCGPS